MQFDYVDICSLLRRKYGENSKGLNENVILMAQFNKQVL